MRNVIRFELYKNEKHRTRNTGDIMHNNVARSSSAVSDCKKSDVLNHIGTFDCLIDTLKKKQTNKYTYEDAENLARQILKINNRTEQHGATPIIDIAKKFGFSVFEHSGMPENVSGNIFINGTTEKIYGAKKVIIVGKQEEYFHQRFIVAHELGHYLMDFLGNSTFENEKKLFQKEYIKAQHSSEILFDKNNVDIERRADHFAAELLMPTSLFLSEYERAREKSNNLIYIIAYLSAYFKTKKSSVERRLQEVMP